MQQTSQDNNTAPIILDLLDFDGCADKLFQEYSPKKVNILDGQEVTSIDSAIAEDIEQNPLMEFLRDHIRVSKQWLLGIGSNRQDLGTDLLNYRFKRKHGLCWANFNLLVEYLKNTSPTKSSIDFSALVLTDIENEQKIGKSVFNHPFIQYTVDEESKNIRSDIIDQWAQKECTPDESKLALILMNIHAVADQYRDDRQAQLIVNFTDDRMDILTKLDELLGKHPNLIHKSVTLNLNHFQSYNSDPVLCQSSLRGYGSTLTEERWRALIMAIIAPTAFEYNWRKGMVQPPSVEEVLDDYNQRLDPLFEEKIHVVMHYQPSRLVKGSSILGLCLFIVGIIVSCIASSKMNWRFNIRFQKLDYSTMFGAAALSTTIGFIGLVVCAIHYACCTHSSVDNTPEEKHLPISENNQLEKNLVI